MIQVQPYLFFNGNCREAMDFYHKTIGGELQLMTYAETPGGNFPKDMADKVMHAALTNGSLLFMASDGMTPEPVNFNSGVHLILTVDSVEEVERLFHALGNGGRVEMPLEETFWSKRFGSVVDRYGLYWLINCDAR